MEGGYRRMIYKIAYWITMIGYLVLACYGQGTKGIAIGFSALVLNALVFWR